jgi:hypothetical protein
MRMRVLCLQTCRPFPVWGAMQRSQHNRQGHLAPPLLVLQARRDQRHPNSGL